MPHQQSDRLRVERNPTVLVGLRVLLPRAAVQLSDAPLDRQYPADEIDVVPAERTQLASTEPRHHRQPYKHGPVGVCPRLVQDPCRFLGGRRLRVRRGLLRGLRVFDRVRRQPAPAHRAFQGAAENDVDLPDRQLRQRPAGVWAATVVALVRPPRAVVRVGPTVAMRPAPAQLRVERVEHGRAQRTDLLLPDQREDV